MSQDEGSSTSFKIQQGTDAGSTQELWNRFRNLDIAANRQLDEGLITELKFVLKALVRYSITKEYAGKLHDLDLCLRELGVYNVGKPVNHEDHFLKYNQQLQNELKGIEKYGDEVFSILVETGQIAVKEPGVSRG